MYYVVGPDGRETGPLEVEVLRSWAASGQLPGFAPVRKEGSDPIPAAQMPELADFYRPAKPPGMFEGMIPTGNPAALWGYYLGFGGLFPILGALAVPFGLWQSIAGLKAFQANPEVRGRTHSIVGIILAIVGFGIQLLCVTIIIAVTRSQP